MSTRSKLCVAATLLGLSLSLACRSAPPAARAGNALPQRTWEGLSATLWVQTAAESTLLSEATFAAAGAALERALADPAWSAVGQGAEAAALPVAVIVDVDETMLDNVAYQAELLLRGEAFGAASWGAWVSAAVAPARPGALEFARVAAARGVTIFYVTNRDPDQETATRENLLRAGFPLSEQVDAVLMENERPGWGRDKESRRAAVAADYRVVLLLGDDLNDFVTADRLTFAERRELADRVRPHFGVDWFLFANPMYGSWQRALGGNLSGLSAEEVARRRAASLRGTE